MSEKEIKKWQIQIGKKNAKEFAKKHQKSIIKSIIIWSAVTLLFAVYMILNILILIIVK